MRTIKDVTANGPRMDGDKRVGQVRHYDSLERHGIHKDMHNFRRPPYYMCEQKVGRREKKDV